MLHKDKAVTDSDTLVLFKTREADSMYKPYPKTVSKVKNYTSLGKENVSRIFK